MKGLHQFSWTLVTMVVAMMVIPAPSARADDFAKQVDLSPLRTLSIQHNQVLKTMDSFARQTISSITGRSSFEGQDPLYTVLDIAFRPEQYPNVNLIKIKNAPLRQDMRLLQGVDDAEKERIVQSGMVSFNFLLTPEVQELMQRMQATALYKQRAISDVYTAVNQFQMLGNPDLPVLRLIPPATNDTRRDAWHSFGEIVGNSPSLAAQLHAHGGKVPAPLPGFEADGDKLDKIANQMLLLREAWRSRNAADANGAIQSLAQLLPQVNPAVYPSQAKRHVEVIYNRLAKMTMPGAAIYFVAFVLFLLSARSGVGTMRLWALRLFVLGFAVHTAGILIRWWLVQTSAGSWFEGIPIKNQFESVLFSAWFGCAVGLGLELWRSKGIFGAAASFVGWLSLVSIFATPYVSGREIGGEIGQVSGVLMSYWLYIHVTMVTASYALIGMGFAMSIWWLVRYYSEFGTLSRTPAHQLSADVARFDEVSPAGAGGAAASLGMWRTIGMLLFVSQARPATPIRAKTVDKEAAALQSRSFLATLDRCNLVILQMAFWLLGLGIVMGAIWADESWGRPWGWDPKETFALVTWIVYLIVVHVRVATNDKAWWTAVLSIIGFGIMLFNWIGVNFFLVGLHSYA
ncbi:MAG: cytochrome c biogenesis protein CcsA [Phycisphaerales bacterium]|nr:cytochrome c biogenesis protein CcsA [Phycisphaerales bacterium]